MIAAAIIVGAVFLLSGMFGAAMTFVGIKRAEYGTTICGIILALASAVLLGNLGVVLNLMGVSW